MSRLTPARTLIVLLAGTLMVTATAQAQTTWYVDDDAPNDPGPGTPNVSDPNENGSVEHPFDAIQEGIDAASNGDTVLVLDGTYTGDGNRDLDFGGRLITVRSQNGPDKCVIDCHGTPLDPHRGFYFHNYETADAVVDGFTVTNASADWGAGMYIFASSPTVANCTFCWNFDAFDGGGMFNWYGNPTVTNCTFYGNMAYGGGGMSNWDSSPTVTNCTFSDNWALLGGGMLNDDSDPTVTDCTFRRNWGEMPGGGMANDGDSTPIVINCTFSDNWAFDGGGMSNGADGTTVANCTFTENSATGFGGGMLTSGGSTTVTNCTFSSNSALSGGGMAIWYSGHGGPRLANCTFAFNSATDPDAIGGIGYGDDVNIINSVLWGNTPHEIGGGPMHQVLVTYCDVQGGWPGVGNIDADPLFSDPNNGDYRLGAGSPCVDAGCNWGVPPDTADLDGDGDTEEITPLDLDGEGRFFDDPNTPDTGCGFPPIVDMGAYEFGDTGPQPCLGDFNGDRVVDLGDLAALLANYGEIEICEGDLDCDGDVDLSDLSALLAVYGTTCS